MSRILFLCFLSTLYYFLSLTGADTGELRPTDLDVFEGGCIRNVVPVQKSHFGHIYTGLISTFASQSHFRLLAEVFLGRPAQNQEEINYLCHSFILTDVTITHIVYGDRIYVANGVINPPNVYTWPQVPLLKSPGVFDFPYVSTIIWTNPDHILFADCFDGRLNTWNLVSRKLPSEEVKAEVLRQITAYGFNPSLAWDMTNSTQTGTVYSCLDVPYSFSEASTKTLLALDTFDDPTLIFNPLPQPVTYLGGEYSTLAEYYRVLLGPIRDFVKEAVEHCRIGGYVPSGNGYNRPKPHRAYDAGNYSTLDGPENQKLLGCQLLEG